MDNWLVLFVVLYLSYGVLKLFKPAWFKKSSTEERALPEFYGDDTAFFRWLYSSVGTPDEQPTTVGTQSAHYSAGIFRNRALTLIHKPSSSDQHQILEIRIPVQQKFWLCMNRQRLQEEDADEIQTGHAWLDREYVIQTNHKEAAQEFLQRHSVKEHFADFPCTFDRFEIIKGELILTLNEPRLWNMQPSHLTSLLRKLDPICTDYEMDHSLIVMQPVSAPYGSRCPYCRGILDALSDPAIQCSQCSTRLHESCWNENRQCTTWGCKSTETERNVELE